MKKLPSLTITIAVLIAAVAAGWYAVRNESDYDTNRLERQNVPERRSRPDNPQPEVKVYLPGKGEITEADHGSGFFYKAAERFSVILDGERFPPEKTACDGGSAGKIAGVPSVKPPFQAVRFEAVAAGNCILSNGDFWVAIAVSDAEICAQVVTPAKNPLTGKTRDFPTPCDVPPGWEISVAP